MTVQRGSGMELSVLKLGSPRKRFASAQFSIDFDSGGYTNLGGHPTPPATATVSPLGRAAHEDFETVFEQHRAAIPFVWEEKPGTPRGFSARHMEDGFSISEEDDSEGSNPSSRNSSTRETSSDFTFSAPNFETSPDFEFASPRAPEHEDEEASKTADELFAQGQILPLKPPPRLQSIKQLMAEDGPAYARTPGHSFRKDGLRTPTRSFRKDGLKAFMASPDGEKQVPTMLGFDEYPKNGAGGHRRTSSLSKLPALFRRRHGTGKENSNSDVFGHELLDGSSFENPRSASSRTMDGALRKEDAMAESSRGVDGKVDFGKDSGRRILEEEGECEEEGAERPQKKRQGRLSRFFAKKPSAVAPSPSPEDLKVKRVHQPSPLLKMCLSNRIGQALFRGVNHFRSLDSQQQQRALVLTR